MSYTKGEWEVSSNGKDFDICQENAGDMIADLKDCDNAQANAQLISASPDLLEACKDIITAWNTPTYGDDEAKLDILFDKINRIEQAIQKAEGTL